MFYIETGQLDKLIVRNTSIDTVVSIGSGGVFYVQLMKKGEILIDTNTTISNFYVNNTQKGSLFYSALEKDV